MPWMMHRKLSRVASELSARGKFYDHLSLDFGGPAIDQVGSVAPLRNRLARSRTQNRRAFQHPDLANAAIGCNEHPQGHGPAQAIAPRHIGIMGLNPADQARFQSCA